MEPALPVGQRPSVSHSAHCGTGTGGTGGFSGGTVVEDPGDSGDVGPPPRGQEDPLEKDMATHSSVLAWRIPCTEEPGGLQSVGSQRVRHDSETKL